MSAHVPGERVDWFRVLTDLDRVGFSNAEVARVLGVPRCRVWNWKEGCEPRHFDGVRLVALWFRETKTEAIEAPVTRG